MTETIQYDLFIVYADGDAGWVERVLIPSLGVPSEKILTKEGFRPGADKIAEFERAVISSQYTLLILRPEFFTDVWARYAGAIASHSRVKQQHDRLLLLILRPCELPQHLDQIVSFDCTNEARWQHEIERLRIFLNNPESPLESVHCPSPAVETPNKLSSSQYSFSTFPQNIQQLIDKNKIKAALDQLEKHLVSIDEPDLQDDFIGLSICYYRHQKEKDLLSQNILRLSQEITNRKMKLSLAPISLKMSLEENFDKSFETRHRLYNGKIKLRICKRLTHDWPDLADYLDIPLSVRKRFEPGREPQGVWEWLEERGRLNELPEALVEIDRHDLIKYFEEQ